MTLMFFVIIGC